LSCASIPEILVTSYGSILCFFSILLSSQPLQAQQQTVIRTTSSLVLVDVMAHDKKSGEPIDGLTAKDFQVLDNGKPVSIAAFDSGSDFKLRPIQLWFVVMCNQLDWKEQGSGFFAGKASLLGPAFLNLRADDTIGVAHWCDNGESLIDLSPTRDREKPLSTIEQVVHSKPVHFTTRQGELALQHILQLVHDSVRATSPSPLPAIVFIHGDHTGMSNAEKDLVSDGLMEVSGMVYLMNDGYFEWAPRYGVINYVSRRTGGEVFKVQHNQYAAPMAKIIRDLQHRYQLAFVPEAADKHVHSLEVRLTDSAREKYSAVLLRHRDSYFNFPWQTAPGSLGRIKSIEQLDSRMQAAMQAPANGGDIQFEVSSMASGAPRSENFALRLDFHSLTWGTTPNGDRRTVVTVVISSLSKEGRPIDFVVKDLEIVQDKSRLEALAYKPVALVLNAAVAEDTASVRVIVRDVASGRIGTRDLLPDATPVSPSPHTNATKQSERN